METIIVAIVLGIIILALLWERHLYTKQMTTQLSEATRAVMSRNINEFMAATKPEPKNVKEFTRDEEINLEELDDKEFMETINK